MTPLALVRDPGAAPAVAQGVTKLHAPRGEPANVARRASVRVEHGFCPLAGRVTYAIWDGRTPVVPAVVYLRSLDDAADNTLRRMAFALLDPLRWLATQSFEFYKLTEACVKLYRASLMRRVHLREVPMRPPDQPGVARAAAMRRALEARHDGGPISRATADAYLSALYHLLRFWLIATAPPPEPGLEVRGRGTLAHLAFTPHRRPALFRIRARPRNRPGIRRGLPPMLLARVWRALESARPHPSKVLDMPAVTPKQVERRRRAELAYARRRLLFYRNKALWALMLASGCRIGEVVRIRPADVDRATGYLRLQDRLEDEYLGRLKTGPDDIFIGFHDRYLAHIDEWLMHGAVALRDVRRLLGKDAASAHPMLFSDEDGGPLRQPAIRSLFRRLYRDCKLREANVKFSPHITRHTIATMMKSNGVPLHVRQAFLRHSHAATTDQYGHMHDPVVRAAVTAFWNGLGRVPLSPRAEA